MRKHMVHYIAKVSQPSHIMLLVLLQNIAVLEQYYWQVELSISDSILAKFIHFKLYVISPSSPQCLPIVSQVQVIRQDSPK